MTNNNDCPICMDTISNEHITICNHKFCLNCINIWLVSHINCPICRKIIKENTIQPYSSISQSNDVSSNNVFIFARNYNFLRISNGMASLNYSN